MKNSFTCQRGFIAGGMLRGYFKDNYLDCQMKMCVSDVPPSFVIDSNDEKTITQFQLSDFYRPENTNRVRSIQENSNSSS